MSNRIKITGYVNIEDHEIDPDHPSGMTEEAYLDYVMDESGTGLKVADLTEIEVELA